MEKLKRKVRVYELNFEKTMPYFLNQINCGKFLSKIVCKKIDFEKGFFYTILPQNSNFDKLYDFEYGGIIPSIKQGTNKPKTIITMDYECSEFIAEFLSKNDANWAVIENYLLEPTSPFIEVKNVKTTSLGTDVYYFLNKKNSEDEIYKTIRKSSLVWHFLAVLTHIKRSIPLVLTSSIIDEICKDVQFVLTNAYDGEGYIFWKKTK